MFCCMLGIVLVGVWNQIICLFVVCCVGPETVSFDFILSLMSSLVAFNVVSSFTILLVIASSFMPLINCYFNHLSISLWLHSAVLLFVFCPSIPQLIPHFSIQFAIL